MTPVSGFQRLARNLLGLLQARFVLLKKAGSFAAIGVINSVVDFTIFLLAYQVLALPLVAANLVAWLVAVSGSYVLNSFITFAAESGRRLTLGSYLAFVASGIAGVTASTAALVLVSYLIPVVAAKLIAIAVSFLVNFSLSHLVVFRHRDVGSRQARAGKTVLTPDA